MLSWANIFETSLEPKRVPGIYAIINRNNLKIYVGSASSLRQRLSSHRHVLSRGMHENRYLKSAFLKNPDAFEYVVIEEVNDKSKLLEREQFWMDFYKSYITENGYNLCPKAGSCLGIKRTEEYVERVASKLRGRKLPLDVVLRRAKAQTGIKKKSRTPEQRAAMSILRKGWKPSVESSRRGAETRKRLKCKCRQVIQMDNQGVEIMRFDSVKEAHNSLGFKRGNISSACNGKRPSAFGFQWKYA